MRIILGKNRSYVMTIRELEDSIARKLAELPFIPQGFRVCVELHGNQRRKRRSASAENWQPTRGEHGIFRLEPCADSHESAFDQMNQRSPEGSSAADSKLKSPSDPIRDLIGALAKAEAIPGYQFIALKWFRDTYLPGQSFGWAVNADIRKKLVAEAIEEGLILLGKIPNPRQPYPTTTVRVNRNNAVSAAVLGIDAHSGWGFTPIELPGEPISKTMLRDRG